ncbi:alpha/beta hydrolase-fold protein [Aquimarina algicola]|uniref:Esterase n=1 Tax=Aquimarina algicola TaxID=2589995 RepID=A0A504J1M4_9FLAO|nr:alpha/beta hydrolase-fold protein [Aquimarina algicola]TPN84766.1 esterase [Aquimarina algicola]
MKPLFIFSIYFFITITCIAQQDNSQVTIGVTHTIKSSILDQDRTIQIYTPNSYSSSEQKYPVLYILDGQWYFSSGVSIQKALRTPSTIPEMIVVGINNSNPLRRTLFGDENKKFTDFLTSEVIQYIDSNYRTNRERIIFGWENAAYYISKLILKNNQVFTGAIITNGGSASEDLIKTFTSEKEIYLFMANSKKDIYNINETEAFYELLKKNNPKNLIWKYELFNDEMHVSLPHLSLYKGLRYYYHNYDSPIFESIQQYIESGEMSYLNTYFKERAKRFGGDGQITDKTKNRLIWLAWNRNDFKYFNIFMTEFEDVLTTKRYDSAYWQNRFGQFYLKHKDYQNAIKYFNIGLAKYPNSEYEEKMQQGIALAKSSKDKPK